MASAETRRAVEGAAARLAGAGAAVSELELGPELSGLYGAQKTIMEYEIARSFEAHRRERPELLSPSLREVIDAGAATPDERYRSAQDLARRARALLPRAMAGVDVLLAPGVVGEAPRGLASTGDPAFCRVWTLLHVPCVNVPAASGPRGLPVGVQLVGPPGRDAELLAATEWIAAQLR